MNIRLTDDAHLSPDGNTITVEGIEHNVIIRDVPAAVVHHNLKTGARIEWNVIKPVKTWTDEYGNINRINEHGNGIVTTAIREEV